MNATGHTLQLGQARIAGAAASRGLLSEGLERVPLALLGLAEEELLLIPRLSSRAVLRSGADGRVDPCFGNSLGAELAATLAAAAIDPLPGTRAPAYRFTTRLTFASWLLGTWARGGGAGQGRAGPGLGSEFAGVSALQWARGHLFDDGRSLPGVFAALARQGLAATVLARLDPADVARMRAALARSHGLPVPAWPVAGQAGAGAAAPALVALAGAARAAGNDLAALPAAALELLLALLLLERDPSTPRLALAAAAAAVAALPSAGSGLSAGPAPPSIAPISSAATLSPKAPKPTPPPTGPVTNPSDAASSALQPPRSGPPAPLPPAPPRQEATGVARPRAALSAAASPPPPPPAVVAPPDTDATNPTPTDPTPMATVGFTSGFAGLWFLCNAFVALGLYGDFSRPSDGRLALAPSRLLDQLALRWFGASYRDDRLHKALVRDGADPPLPECWQVQPAWLEAFAAEEGSFRVTSRHHQTLWHPAGFPLRDAPLPRRKGPRDTRRSMAARRDTGRPMAGRRNTGRPMAGRRDTGRSMAGRRDTGRSMAGRRDIGWRMAGWRDTRRSMAGRRDTGRSMAGRRDIGWRMAGRRDTGWSMAGRRDIGRRMAGRRQQGLSPGRFSGRIWRPACSRRPVPHLPSAQAARWLACLALYLDARIKRATGDPALGLSSLAIPGQCRLGAERVDVDLALADLPLPLRLAGLDRDPGWLPAEGRTIAFHFA